MTKILLCDKENLTARYWLKIGCM